MLCSREIFTDQSYHACIRSGKNPSIRSDACMTADYARGQPASAWPLAGQPCKVDCDLHMALRSPLQPSTEKCHLERHHQEQHRARVASGRQQPAGCHLPALVEPRAPTPIKSRRYLGHESAQTPHGGLLQQTRNRDSRTTCSTPTNIGNPG